MRTLAKTVCALALPFLLAAESQAPDEGRAILAERDALIQKIANGDDYERSVNRFIELKKRFEKLVVELKLKPDGAPIDRQRLAMEKQHQYQRTLDFRVGEQCPMNIDPEKRRNGEGGSVFRADFGKIVAKKTAACSRASTTSRCATRTTGTAAPSSASSSACFLPVIVHVTTFGFSKVRRCLRTSR